MNNLLTDDDLILLRAALQFWSEELEPHGPSAWQPYLDRSISIEAGHTAELRRLLLHSELRYTTVKRVGDRAGRTGLHRTPLAAVASADDAVVATVLISTAE